MSRDNSMKIHGERPSTPQRARPVKAFGEVLKVIGSATAKSRDQRLMHASLGRARTAMNAESSRLGEVRAEGHADQEKRIQGRVFDLIAKELAAELTAAPERNPERERGVARAAVEGKDPALAGPQLAGPGGAASPSGATETRIQASTRTQAALALVERIEAFVKSNRPALAVAVGGALDARVEIERTGPGQVALRVQGRRGPPPPEDLARIREAVRARGLVLSSISVGQET